MEELYLHYIHVNKCWFYWFSSSSDNKIFRPYTWNDDICYVDSIFGDGCGYTEFLGSYITKSKAKKILKDMFPTFDPILTYPYHKGYGAGSRPYKDTWTKDNYCKERGFKKSKEECNWKK